MSAFEQDAHTGADMDISDSERAGEMTALGVAAAEAQEALGLATSPQKVLEEQQRALDEFAPQVLGDQGRDSVDPSPSDDDEVPAKDPRLMAPEKIADPAKKKRYTKPIWGGFRGTTDEVEELSKS